MKGRKAPEHLRWSKDSSSAEKTFSSSPQGGESGWGTELGGTGGAGGPLPKENLGVLAEPGERLRDLSRKGAAAAAGDFWWWKSTGDIFL